MAERDQFTTRIDYEHDDAKLRDATKGMQQHGKQTEQAGESAQRATNQHRNQTAELNNQTGVVGRLGGAVRSMVASWLGFTAISNVVVGVLRRIQEESSKAADAVERLGGRVRDLAVNLGPQTDEVMSRIDNMAETLEQRDALVDYAAELTGRRPELQTDVEALGGHLSRARHLPSLTGASGKELAQTVMSLEEAGFDRPEDAAAVLLTGGLDTSSVRDIALRGGREGIELTLAAMRSGDMHAGRAAESMPQLLSALDQRDASGELTKELRAIGVTDDMTFNQRIRQVGAAMEGQDMARRAMAQDMVGEGAREALPVMLRAIESGGVSRVREELDTATAAALRERQLKSEFYEVGEEAGSRELREKQWEESLGRSRRQRLLEEVRQTRKDRGQGPVSRHFAGWLDFVTPKAGFERQLQERELPDGSSYTELDDISERASDRFRVRPDDEAGQGTTIINNNTTNIRNNYGNPSPATADLEGPAFRQ